jgi:hypothetical protein
MFQCLFDFYVIHCTVCRFQWPRCLGRGSAAGIAGSNPAVGDDVCVVSVVQSGQKAKPGQSGQRRTDKVQRKKSGWVHACLSLVSGVCCQVEVSATGRSLVQRSPTYCGVSLCVI